MTLWPTLLAPLLVIAVAVGGYLIFYVTEPKPRSSTARPGAERRRAAVRQPGSAGGEASQL